MDALLLADSGVRLAPLYDLVSTAVYPGLDRKMAMKLGGEQRPDYVRRPTSSAARGGSPASCSERGPEGFARLSTPSNCDLAPAVREWRLCEALHGVLGGKSVPSSRIAPSPSVGHT